MASHPLRLILLACLLFSCVVQEGSVPSFPERDSALAAEEAAARNEPLPELIVHPWTKRFQAKSALVADYVRISGPKGLLAHVVVEQDPLHFEFQTETTAAGLVATTSIREDVDIFDPIRAKLDGMQVMALRKVVIIERPGPVQVEVRATGNAYWHEISTGEERRSESILLEGAIDRPETSDG